MSRRETVVLAVLLFIGALLLQSALGQTPIRRTSPIQQAVPVQQRVPQTASDPAVAQQGRLAPVSTDSLGKTHQLVGPLGIALGDMVTVTLRVTPTPEKDTFNHYIEVVAIGGRRLRQPVRMPAKLWAWGDIKSLREGDLLTAKVYQDGGMIGVPDQVLNETVPVSTVGHGFVTWLVIVKSAR